MARLTASEKKWLADLQAVLDACPSKRLGFYTIGDPQVMVYDFRKEKLIDEKMMASSSDFCVVAEQVKANIGFIKFPRPVHATSG